MNNTSSDIKFIVLSGPSGGGKSTICKMLMDKYPRIAISVSSTTREKRPKEVFGKSYFFISREDFLKLIEEGEMLEWAEVHGNLYGTRKKLVDDLLQKGKLVLFDVDVKGMKSIQKVYPDNIISFFLQVPSIDELERRLRFRDTDSEEKIRERMRNAKEEVKSANIFDYSVINSDLNKTFDEICKILEEKLIIHE